MSGNTSGQGPSQSPADLAESKRFGTPGGIRTPDPLVRSQMLYPLSYGRTVGERRSGRNISGAHFVPFILIRIYDRRDQLDEPPERVGQCVGKGFLQRIAFK